MFSVRSSNVLTSIYIFYRTLFQYKYILASIVYFMLTILDFIANRLDYSPVNMTGF